MTQERVPVGPAVLAVGLALLVVPIVVTLALVPSGSSSGSSGSATPAPAASTPATTATANGKRPAIEPPPEHAYVDGEQSGRWAVGLALAPGRRVGLTVTVLGGDAKGVDGLRPRAEVSPQRGGAIHAGLVPCGHGCYRTTLPAGAVPRHVAVQLRASDTPVVFQLPAAWPPKSADALVRRATRVYTHLRTVSVYDTLGSGTGVTVVSTWRLEAPDRLSYAIRGNGAEAIVVGDTRWDRASPTSPWVRSPQTPLQQPATFWSPHPYDAYEVGPAPGAGKDAVAISFVDRGQFPIWFTVAVDRRSGRPLSMRMTTTSHFMHERYYDFDTPARVRPPSTG